MRGRRLYSWNGHQKLRIAINWFSSGFQTDKFVAEHERMTYYMYHETPEHAL